MTDTTNDQNKDNPANLPLTPEQVAKLTNDAMSAAKKSAETLRDIGRKELEQAKRFDAYCNEIADQVEAGASRIVKELEAFAGGIIHRALQVYRVETGAPIEAPTAEDLERARGMLGVREETREVHVPNDLQERLAASLEDGDRLDEFRRRRGMLG